MAKRIEVRPPYGEIEGSCNVCKKPTVACVSIGNGRVQLESRVCLPHLRKLISLLVMQGRLIEAARAKR